MLESCHYQVIKGCLTPRVCPRGGGGGGSPERNGPESYRDYVPPCDVTGEVFGLNDATVLNPAIAVAASLAVFAGTGVPAVAEDLSLAEDDGGLPLVIHISDPLRAAAEADPLIDEGKASSVDLRRPTGLSGSDAQRGSEEGGSQFDIVTVPELIEHPDSPIRLPLARMIGWAEETAWISHPTSVLRDMSRRRIVERRLWSGPLARRLRGS